MKLRVLDLFSGIGGFSLGLERTGGFETVAFCEIEDFPRRVLAKHWPDVPCFSDIRKLTKEDLDGPVDVICGGSPCQPFSTAGRRRGAEDDRHLWPEFARLVDELRPSWVIGENVAGHVSMGLDDVLSDLEGQGYACRTFILPACAVGHAHRRDRCWTVAHSDSQRNSPMRGECSPSQGEGCCGRNGRARSGGDAEREVSVRGAREVEGNVAHSKRHDVRREQRERSDSKERSQPRERQVGSCGDGFGWRSTQSRMGGVADGVSAGLDEPGERVKAGIKGRAVRLKALGNAVVPQIPEMIGHAILSAQEAA